MASKKENEEKGKEKEKEKEVKEKRKTIGALCREMIMEGKTNDEILAAVGIEFPDAKTTSNSVNWYRNDLRKKGHTVPKPDKKKMDANNNPNASAPKTTETGAKSKKA